VASTSGQKQPAAKATAKPTAVRPSAGEGGEILDLGVLNDVLGFRLRRIQNHLARAFQEDPRHGDLKSGLYSILALISANPGVSQARIALEAGIDKTALVALLDDLEVAGWAVRVRAKDRRKHSLHVTDKGAAALNTLTAAAHETEATARGGLTGEELAQLLTILDKLYASCFREEEL
jgi:DNA-binding MarR family transcriptional regulator